MDKITADKLGALLYKLVEETPDEISAQDVNKFKSILDEENLHQLIALDETRQLEKIAYLKKRTESFKEKLALGKQAIEEAKNYGDVLEDQDKKERRSRVAKLIKKSLKKKETPAASPSSAQTPPPQKEKIDLEQLAQTQRRHVALDLKKRIINQEKPSATPPPPTAEKIITTPPPTTAFEIPSLIEDYTDDSSEKNSVSSPLPPPPSAAPEPPAAAPPAITLHPITAQTNEPPPTPPPQTPSTQPINGNNPPPQAPATPYFTSNLATTNLANLDFYPTINDYKIDDGSIETLGRKGKNILDTLQFTPLSQITPPPATTTPPPPTQTAPPPPKVAPVAPLPQTEEPKLTSPIPTSPLAEEEETAAAPPPTPPPSQEEVALTEETIPPAAGEQTVLSTQASPAPPDTTENNQAIPPSIPPPAPPAPLSTTIPLIDAASGISGIEEVMPETALAAKEDPSAQASRAPTSEILPTVQAATEAPPPPANAPPKVADTAAALATTPPIQSAPPASTPTQAPEHNIAEDSPLKQPPSPPPAAQTETTETTANQLADPLKDVPIDLENLEFTPPKLTEDTKDFPPPSTNTGGADKDDEAKNTLTPPPAPASPSASPSHIDYDRAFHMIRSFQAENRDVILAALQTDQAVTHNEANEIAERVLNNEDEERLTNFVRNLIFQKSYQEPPTQAKHKEVKLLDEAYKKSKAQTFAKRSAAILIIALISFFTITYGIDYAHSSILYARAYRQAQENNFIVSETYFERARSIRHSDYAIQKIGKLYHVDKRKLAAAEKKYRAVLAVNSTYQPTLLSYTQLLIDDKRFPAAAQQLTFLEETFGTTQKPTREVAGEYFIAWGRQETLSAKRERRLNRAQFIYGELLAEAGVFGHRPFYLARLLEISSLKNDYTEAQNRYAKLHNLDPTYTEARSFTTYADFLTTTYRLENSTNIRPIAQAPPTPLLAQKNTSIVTHAENVLLKLYTYARDYLPLYYTAGRWNMVTGELDRALAWSADGIKIYQATGTPFEFEPNLLFTLDGEIKYHLNEYEAAKTSLITARQFNENDPYANYYLGKVQLKQENTSLPAALASYKNAQNYLLTALDHLTYYARPFPATSADYHDLRYTTGYSYYQLSRLLHESTTQLNHNLSNSRSARNFPPNPPTPPNETTIYLPQTVSPTPKAPSKLTAEREAQLEKALFYWNPLLTNVSIDKRYILDYATANAYLLLGRYQLAEAKTQQAISELAGSYEYYRQNETTLTATIQHEMSVLSDLYNNLGIIKAELRAQRSSNPYLLKQAALENFINAITIKDQLSLLRGQAYANFNTLNYELKEPRGFLMTDAYMPDELF